MAKRHDGGTREPRAGPQAGMGQLVDQNEVVGAYQRGDDAEIREIAGAKDARSLRPLEPGKPRFEFAEQRMMAGHEAEGACTPTMGAQRLDGRLLDGWVMGPREVIV